MRFPTSAQFSNNESFVKGQRANLAEQPNYMCMTGLDVDDLSRLSLEAEHVCKFLKQRGDAWFELRKKANVTGIYIQYTWY